VAGSESAILNATDWAFLRKVMPSPWKSKSVYRVYQATKDGKTLSALTSKGFGHGGTISVYKNNHGKKFGGFLDLDWKSYDKYFRSEKAFIFSLDAKKTYYSKSGTNNAYTDYSSYGAAWADDLYITSTFGGNINPVAYIIEDPLEVCGQKAWQVEELEMFAFK